MAQSILSKMSKRPMLRRRVGKPFLRVNEWVWNHIPGSWKALRPVISYGAFLHLLERLRANRAQYHGTFFFRNRPELELLRALCNQKPEGSTLQITVLACSNGAEVHSIAWTIRLARPDLKLIVHAIDISNEILEIAKRGVYKLGKDRLVNAPIFERLSNEEMDLLFDREKDEVQIKPWIAEGINWQAGDAGDPALVKRLGPQDMVVANRFLCHMSPPEAERCLRNLAHLVKPGGYLLVSGVDLDIRTKVAIDLGWTPVVDRLEEIHNGDPSVRRDWPLKYWGLEPLDTRRRDWKIRYASVFQISSPTGARQLVSVPE